MNKGINIIMGLAVIIALLVASGAFYVIDETQQVVLTQFGRLVGEPKTEAGLYFKLPFIQTANSFDKRVLQWDGDADEFPTRDKRFIWVDTTARWRIADPLKFMQSVSSENAAQTRLDDIIDGSTRKIISDHVLVEAVRNSNNILDREKASGAPMDELGKTALLRIEAGREELSRKILSRASEFVPAYGIELIDVRIKRINYEKKVRDKVYERMISERKRAAEQFRSEGQGKKAEIEGQMVKELEQIRAEAYKTAQEVKGKADAMAIKIYADAYNKDPEFYSFIKTLESYKNTVGADTSLVLTTDNEYYEYINGVDVKSRNP